MIFSSEYQLIRLKQVIELTSLSKSSIYRLIGCDDFPRPVPLGARSVAWSKYEVEQWCSRKIASAQCS